MATFKHDTRVPTADFRGSNGSQIVTGDADGNVYLWDVAAALADDDRKLETAKKEYTGGPWRHEGLVHRVRVSPDGSRILTASYDNTARLWDPERGAEAGRFEHQGAVEGVAFSPDGSLVVTACSDNTARRWRPAAGQSLRIVRHPGTGNHEAILTSDGRYVLTKDAETVLVRDARTGARLAVFYQRGGIRAVAVSPDGSIILAGGADRTGRLWDAATGTPIGPACRHGSEVWAVAFSPDGAQMLTGAFDGSVQLRDVSTGALIGKLELGARVWGAAFSPVGSHIVVATMDKVARVFEASLTSPPRTLVGHQSAVVGVAFSRDGNRIVTASHDNTARVWDAATGEPVSDPMPHRGPLWYAASAAFSPDGRAVVTGCDDRTVQIWDVATSRPIGPALRHEAGVRMVAFTSDSEIRTGTTLGAVRLWEPTISPLEGDIERITTWLEVITGMELDSDGTLRVLDARRWRERQERLREIGGPLR